MGLLNTSNRAGASGQSAGGGGGNLGTFYTHQIEKSARFDAAGTSSNASRLTRTFSSVTSNTDFTLNFWIKRSGTGALGSNPQGSTRPHTFFTPRSSTSGSVLHEFSFMAPSSYGRGDALVVTNTNSGAYVLSSSSIYTDVTSWINIHMQFDLNNGTASEKVKFFINGTEAPYQTDNRSSFSSFSGIAAGAWTIGDYYNYGYSINAYIAQWAYTDGYTYAPTIFGETKNGVWIPKDFSSSVTWGNAGHWLKFADASNLGLDSSGQSNNWTVSNMGTDHQTPDSPTFGN